MRSRFYLVSSFLLFTLFLVAGCSSTPAALRPSSQSPDVSLNVPFAGTGLSFNFKNVPYQGGLIVSEGTVLINRSRVILNGNLIVNGSGSLIVEDSELYFNQSYNTQYVLRVGGNGSFILRNVSLLTAGKWMYAEYTENASVVLERVHPWDPNIPWHNAGGASRVFINQSTVGISVVESGQVSASGSNLFFELLLGNVTGIFTLPSGHVPSFELDVPNDQGTFSLQARNSFFRHWGTTLMYNNNVTFKDARMTIGMNAGADWRGNLSPEVRASGLQAGRYDGWSLLFDTNALTLLNTTVTSWYPQAFNNATLLITESDLADVQWNKGNAFVRIERSQAEIAFASEQVTYLFVNSTIDGDVTATGQSIIYLDNTLVKGELREVDAGRIVVIN